MLKHLLWFKVERNNFLKINLKSLEDFGHAPFPHTQMFLTPMSPFSFSSFWLCANFVPFQTFFHRGIKAVEIRQWASQLLSDNLQIKIRKAFVWLLDGGSRGGGSRWFRHYKLHVCVFGNTSVSSFMDSWGLISDYRWNRKACWCSSDALSSPLNHIIITCYGCPTAVLFYLHDNATWWLCECTEVQVGVILHDSLLFPAVVLGASSLLVLPVSDWFITLIWV